jgi:hypothetical protein
MQGVINIYGCGGCGISQVSKLEREANADLAPGYASMKLYYLDTSKSDLVAGLDRDRIFMLGDHAKGLTEEEIEGSGSVRSANNKLIKPMVPKILHAFKPSNDLNIVVSSGSGGSGAVFAAHLVEELLKSGKSVIVIMVTSIDTQIAVSNSIKSIQTYARIASSNERPVVCSHWQNDDITSMAVVDAGVAELISRLRVLYSRQNRKLDKQDLANVLNYTETTSADPKLVYFDVEDGVVDQEDGVDPIAVATLVNEGSEDTKYHTKVEYHPVGYIPEEANIKLKAPWHFCVVDGYAEKALASLRSLESAYNAEIKARRNKTSLLAQDEDDTEIFL